MIPTRLQPMARLKKLEPMALNSSLTAPNCKTSSSVITVGFVQFVAAVAHLTRQFVLIVVVTDISTNLGKLLARIYVLMEPIRKYQRLLTHSRLLVQ